MVSIIIPTFNRPNFLKRLLKNILNQTFTKYELIIVNDNSSDANEYDKVLREFKNKFKEFTYLMNKKNMGAPYSRNRGIRYSKYEFIALVDDDDEWKESKLEQQVNYFLKESDKVGIVYTWADVVQYETKKIIGSMNYCITGNAKKEILDFCFLPSPSVMLRKQALLNAGLFDTKLKSCQDWDMWTKIMMKGYHCQVIPKTLVNYNKHSYESIGSSKKSIKGYTQYYNKHIFEMLLYLPFKKKIKKLKDWISLNLRCLIK